MINKIFKYIFTNPFNVLLLLIIIGLIIHYPSLKMSLYGDEWIDVYHFYNQTPEMAQLSTLPGPLKYLTPYGFGIILIGNLYQLLGTNYWVYFLISLIFKIFTAFCIYLICSYISKSQKLVCFLTAVLLLVGFTGLETTDWAHYMHIYLAAGLFLLALLFQLKFSISPTNKNIFLTLLFSLLSLSIGTVRVFPLIFLLPLHDLYLYVTNNDFKFKKAVFIKSSVFIFLIFVLWAIGLFGHFFQIYSYGDWSFNKFISVIYSSPIVALKSLFHWLGSVILPDYLIESQTIIILFGAIITFICLKSFYYLIFRKSKSEAPMFLVSFLLIFFLTTNWYFLPTSNIGSFHRYLYLIYVVFCLWIFVYLVRLLDKWKFLNNFVILILLLLIIIHGNAVMSKYNYWLNSGRSSEYIYIVDKHLKSDFPNPLTKRTIIYLESDDGSMKQSTIFGLAVKVAVFSRTWTDNLIPEPTDDKDIVLKKINERLKNNETFEEVITSLYGYKIKNKVFTSITDEIRDEIKSLYTI